MYRVTGINEMAQLIEQDNIIKTHEKKARKHLITARIKKLEAQGVAREVAQVLAAVEYDYSL